MGENERLTLADIVPLDTPLSIQVEPSSACNFKCKYCYRQVDPEKYKTSNMLSFDTFKKLIDDVKGFNRPLKSLMFAKIGEPTLNPELPRMVRYAKKSNVVLSTKIITNGSMLNPEFNLDLIDAGLDVLRISIQGLTDAEYRDVCGYNLNMEKFLANIKHFYEHKKQCKVFIKILDTMIKNRKEDFFNIFGNVCDEISIEHEIPARDPKQEDFENIINMMGEKIQYDVICCPLPFYSLNLEVNGDIEICTVRLGEESLLGNVNYNNIVDLWKSDRMNAFRRMQLKGERFTHKICRRCTAPSFCLQSRDCIDDKREELLKWYT
ncbi:radical SAM/SPASM domain-containing protein [Aminipila terrae]|uniref:Radical SAM protein n=1 Tax=Aminipila terrae TaxID=2697030 RepID=A0A6P1MJY2_9FIRM|nr:radical SAM protein [Aminipila terrae]QHI71946.1 radical SAM protein [Aminipila terrae]